MLDVAGRVVAPGSSIRTATRTARSSSTARWPATSTRATRPSCRATAATRWRRSPTSAARRSSCRCGRTSSSPAGGRSGSTSIASRSSRSGRTSRSSSATARSGRRSSAPTRGAPTDDELAAMVAEVEAALDAGAIGLSTGLIYAPGMHAAPAEVEALVAATARRGGLYATHMRNECRRAVRVARRIDRGGPRGGSGRPAPGLAPQVRRRRPSGVGPARRSRAWRRPAPRASTSPPTSTRTRPRRRPSPRSCRRPSWASASTAASRRWPTRTSATASATRWRAGSRAGRTSPPTRAGTGIRIASAASHPDWAGRSLAELADELTPTRRTSPSMRWSTTGSTSRSSSTA